MENNDFNNFNTNESFNGNEFENNDFNNFVTNFNSSDSSNEFENNDFENLDREDNKTSTHSKDVDNVSDVKLGRGATAVIIIALLVILMIILVTLKGCSVQKKVNSTNSETSVNSRVATKQNVIENTIENNQNNADSVANSSEVVTTSPENSGGSKKENSITESLNAQENTIPANSNYLKEVSEVSLSDSITTSGIVVSKKVYYYNNCYIYGLNLSILKGESTVSVMYFCPKKTYDALNSADAITVEYQIDSNDVVSVMSISK